MLLRNLAIVTAILLTSVLARGQERVEAIGSDEDARLVATLVRSTLIGLHHANVTGNYTVFRDLAAPSFQIENNAAKLAVSFAALREQRLDLEVVGILQPEISSAPMVQDNKFLRVTGRFATAPKAIGFDLVYELVGGAWKLAAITVAPNGEKTAN